MIVIVLIRRHRRISYHDKSKVVTLKSYTVKPYDEETNHESVFHNPTYQDVQGVNKSTDNVVLNPTYEDDQDNNKTTETLTYQDDQDDSKTTDAPTYQDDQDDNKNIDNEFSVQLEN